MTDPDQDSEILLDRIHAEGTLDPDILYHFKTLSGQSWATVTTGEAAEMIGRGINAEFPEDDVITTEAQAVIDEGRLAEGLLMRYLVVPDRKTEQPVHADGAITR